MINTPLKRSLHRAVCRKKSVEKAPKTTEIQGKTRGTLYSELFETKRCRFLAVEKLGSSFFHTSIAPFPVAISSIQSKAVRVTIVTEQASAPPWPRSFDRSIAKSVRCPTLISSHEVNSHRIFANETSSFSYWTDLSNSTLILKIRWEMRPQSPYYRHRWIVVDFWLAR